MTNKIDLPDVTFQGSSGDDWRETLADEVDPDDEELDETPADVVMMLGFDPKDMDDDGDIQGEQQAPAQAA